MCQRTLLWVRDHVTVCLGLNVNSSAHNCGSSRLLFKFRSGTHGLNEELGRHGWREGKTECSLCGNECENVSHVLWECSAYSSTRASFRKKLQQLLEDDYEDFESLENVDKLSYVLGSELWESKFDGLLPLVKEYNYCRCLGNTKTSII